jgi:hypothetical protein
VTFAGSSPAGSVVQFQMIIAGSDTWGSAFWYTATSDPDGSWHSQMSPGAAPYEFRARATIPGGPVVYSEIVSFTSHW